MSQYNLCAKEARRPLCYFVSSIAARKHGTGPLGGCYITVESRGGSNTWGVGHLQRERVCGCRECGGSGPGVGGLG